MKHTRVIVTHYGGPDALQVVEEECPEPKHGEVRVRVLVAGVGLPDIMARQGIHPETPRVPFTPGWDLVGEVDRLGEGVSGLEPGQRVAALPNTSHLSQKGGKKKTRKLQSGILPESKKKKQGAFDVQITQN